jgi:hypothetical protein
MESPGHPDGRMAPEPTPRREALRLIIEVFRNGQQAAADLRDRVDGLTPSQLEKELEGIEASMLSQISRICNVFEETHTTLQRQ